MNISEFREKYPQYKDIDDQTLATKFHDKYYSDIPRDQFDEKFLGKTPTPVSPPPQKGNWMQRMQEQPLATAIQTVAPLVKKAAPYLGAANAGTQTLLGGGGPGDYAALPTAVARMSGAKLPGNLPENVPMMGPTGRFGPVIGTGVQLGEAAVNKLYPGSNVSEKIPDKSLGYLTAGAVLPGETALKVEGAVGKAADRIIDFGIQKGIRPSVVGKGTFQQAENYAQKSREAVKTIVANKANLHLTDEFGEVTDKLPQNLRQFSQAIAETKKQIFRQYDELAKQAGQYGPTINLERVSKELEPILNNKALNDNFPGTVAYARQKIETLTKRGMYTTEEAQDAVQQLNESLEAFYKNPSSENIGKAKIDALVANNLRKELDDTIEMSRIADADFGKPSGLGYKALKEKYGALKAIEKEVNQRSVVDARKSVKGLIDFSDIFSGSEVARGILTANPAAVATGAAAKGIAAWYKYLSSPNRHIKNMFESLEKVGGGVISKVGRAAGMEASQQVNQAVGKNIIPMPVASQLPMAAKAGAGAPTPPSAPAQPSGSGIAEASMLTPEQIRPQEGMTASKRGIEFYTANNWDDAIREWRTALKEEPQRAKEIIGWINRAKFEKQKYKELIDRRKNEARNTETGIQKYMGLGKQVASSSY